MKRGTLPVKKLSSSSSRPTTAGLTPTGRPAVEAQVDTIKAKIRAEVDARLGEKENVPTDGAGIEVIGHASSGDIIYDLSPDDLEKEFYARVAQANLAKEALDAGRTVEQLMALKESGAKAKADAVARQTAEAGVGAEVTPGPTKQPADVPVVPAKGAEAPTSGVKLTPDDVPALPPKRPRRRKPKELGTRDG